MKSKCINCNKEFKYSPSQQSGKYCSNRCQHEKQSDIRVENGLAGIKCIRNYLIRKKIYKCVLCENKGEWMGKSIALQLDHIDGNPKNNKLENVRWLCPNCHAQTPNWGVKNAKNIFNMKTSIKR